MDRRLRLALLIGVFVLALLPNLGVPAVASPRASGRIVANEVAQSWPGHQAANLTIPDGAQILSADAGSTGYAEATLLYTSDVINAGQLFDRIAVHWVAAWGEEGALYVDARTSLDGVTWTAWRTFSDDDDVDNPDTNERYGAPLAVDGGARYAQYRIFMTNGDADAVSRVAVTFMDVNDLNVHPVARLLNDIAGAFADWTRGYVDAAPTGTPKILTRQDWAADESLMQWAPRYQKVQKIIIHHSVTDDGGSNVAATIRGIYYYHAVTRGWGDIGYNYLVDKYGNIWTGRQGGDHTIAGHAYGWNNGSLGIVAIGDYSYNPPTGALQGAITNLIALKSKEFGIQPYGNDAFTHQEQAPDGSWVNVTNNPPNVIGHRDANYVLDAHGGQTACPGVIYDLLDGIRSQAQAAVNAGYFDLPYIDPLMPKAAYPGAVVNVPVSVTNRGQGTIPAGTSVSYRILSKGTVTLAQGPQVALPTPLGPGQSTTLGVSFTAPAAGSYIVRWDLQTAGTWWNASKNTPFRDVAFNSADWSVDWLNDNVPIAWTAGETKTITVTLQNDGGRTWNASGVDPIQLGYKWVSNSTGNVFPGAQRVSLPGDVAPGGTVTLTIPMTAPTYPTNYTNYLDLYKVNEFAFADKGVSPDDTPTGVSVDFKATYLVTGQPTFTVGQTTTVPVTITNAGKGVFPATNSYPVDLGYHWYSATGATVLWDGARTKLPADLQPGQSVTLQAQIVAPSAGAQQLRFDLVQEGVAWFSGKGIPTGNYTTTVAGPLVKTYGATYAPSVQTLAVSGSSASVPVSVTNTSNFTWFMTGANPVHLAYHWMDASGKTVIWDGLRTSLPADLVPGGTANLTAALVFPSGSGTFTLRWDMVEEGVSWFSGKDVKTSDQPVSVGSTATLFYGGSMDVSGTPASLAAVATSIYPIKVQNLSTFAWGSNVNLSYHWLTPAGATVVWDGARTSLAGMNPNDVRTVQVRVTAPPTIGSYTLRYDIVQEGVAWFSGNGMQTPTRPVSIAVGGYAATYAPTSPNALGAAGATATVPVTITNVGTLVWQPGVVNASYHLYGADGSVVVWDGVRTKLAAQIDRGQSATVGLQVALPATPGSYTLQVDLVQEGVTWFSGQNIAPARIALQVQ